MTASSGSEALSNARQHSTYETGMCQKFVRSAWEVGSLYGSAIEAWNGAREKHPGDRTPPVGAPCYYKGGQYGHAVVFAGSGDMRSTDCQSRGKVSEADIAWVERTWGYAYLGWTGDINAVDLPLTDPGGGSQEGDDMAHYDHASRKADANLKPETWHSIYWDGVSGEGAFDVGQAYCGIANRDYSAVLHVTVEAPEGTSVYLRTSEWWGGERLETNPQTEFRVTPGASYFTHVQNGHVAADRNLRFEIYAGQGGKLTHADAVVLSW